MPDIKEVLHGFVSKTLNMDEVGVASLYNEDGSVKDDALTTLLQADVERVQKLKPDTRKVFDDGYKKAQSEVLSKFEKDFAERTGFKSDKKGIELILDYAANQAKANGEINEDVIKKHPLFISTTERLLKEKEDAIKAESEKLTTFQKELQAKETFNSVSQKALEIFNSLKPILSTDPVKAKNQLQDFTDKLKSFEYDLQNDKILVSKEGKLLEDDHGNRIPFEKIVRDTAERYYDFHKADPRSSPGNGKEKDAGQKFQFDVPKNEQQYAEMISDTKRSVEERTAIKEAYQKTQTTN